MSTQSITGKEYAYDTTFAKRRNVDDAQSFTGGQVERGRSGEGDNGHGLGQNIRAQIDALLSEVPRGRSGKLTFDAVFAHRDAMRQQFEERVKTDLDKLGVDTDADMVFSFDAGSDTLTVNADHPDKALIDQYFAASEEERRAFGKLVALNKVTAMVERRFSQQDFQAEMQQRSLTLWAQANVPDAFSGGSLVYAQNTPSPTFVGLDLVV